MIVTLQNQNHGIPLISIKDSLISNKDKTVLKLAGFTDQRRISKNYQRSKKKSSRYKISDIVMS